MSRLIKHLITGLTFFAGIIGFVNGEYIISSALFAAATYTSNMGAKIE